MLKQAAPHINLQPSPSLWRSVKCKRSTQLQELKWPLLNMEATAIINPCNTYLSTTWTPYSRTRAKRIIGHTNYTLSTTRGPQRSDSVDKQAHIDNNLPVPVHKVVPLPLAGRLATRQVLIHPITPGSCERQKKIPPMSTLPRHMLDELAPRLFTLQIAQQSRVYPQLWKQEWWRVSS